MKYLKDVMIYRTYNLELLGKYNSILSRFLNCKNPFPNLYSKVYFLLGGSYGFFHKKFLLKKKSFDLQIEFYLKKIGLKLKNYYSKIFYYFVLLLFFTGSFLEAAPGDFVKDVKIPNLTFEFPEVNVFSAGKGTEVYFLPGEEFPLRNLEIHIYAGVLYNPNLPPEIPELFVQAWKHGGVPSAPGSKFIETLEGYGAKIDTDVNSEKIIFTISYLSRFEKEVVPLVREFITSPLLNEEGFAVAKLNLEESIKRRNDKISDIAYRKTAELVYKGTVLGKSAELDSLARISSKDIKEYFDKTVSISKRIVLLTGDLQKEEAEPLIASILPSRENFRNETSVKINTQILKKNLDSLSFQILGVDKDATQSVVMMAGILPAHRDPDFYAIQLANYIIGGGGFSSYLMQKIRSDRGLTYSSGSSTYFERDYGMVYFTTQTKTSTTKEVYDLMREILSEETISKISEKELESAKQSIVNRFIFQFVDKMGILHNFLRFQEHGMPNDYLKKYRDKIQAVTLGDLRRVGKKYFVSSSVKTILTGPKNITKGLNESIKHITPEERIP
ncbi:peptidase M16 inactive domain protein [Leptospira noguchii serovar Autumnalis str. ZUN142]|uniref:Peptidase M16 inactive domain protein n=1 Tax=Leptospira noguchii serovar Autumnalis str. ZUN142 TaxID=1085540 RepID=M6UE45_9LEPT|nr:pitrilysin family protein [Leptospira noguchii]EMO42840.1 peptidase M16 inactive domain protein [Leptospira noguchii serovar Autumnalis str. ZUN142]